MAIRTLLGQRKVVFFQAVTLMALGLGCQAESTEDEDLIGTVAQHNGANINAFWDWISGGTTTLQQQVQIHSKAPASFWAASWWYSDADHGGYMGLQTDGERYDGTFGDTVIFSIWNADTAQGPCAPFGGEGVGYSCRLPYAVEPGHVYTLLTAREDFDGVGQWWAMAVRDDSTGVGTYVGRIRAPAGDTTIGTVLNFSEYFGEQLGCAEVPRSVVDWAPPSGDNFTATSDFTSTRGSCVGGSALPSQILGRSGARISQGGDFGVGGNPVGFLDNVFSAGASQVGLWGWTFDPDATYSLDVHVYADGNFLGAVTANTSRADVQNAYGYGDLHGYEAIFPLAAGPHQICTYAINVSSGDTNTLLGCMNVEVAP